MFYLFILWIYLKDLEKEELFCTTKEGTHKSRKILKAQVLLMISNGKSREEIKTALSIDGNRYYLIKRRYFEEGLPTALEEKSPLLKKKVWQEFVLMNARVSYWIMSLQLQRQNLIVLKKSIKNTLVKEHYPKDQKIKVVQGNYNTHSYGSFYENLPNEQARELKNKLELHCTPKHGSWLNIAEMEFSALSRQCLNKRIGSKELLETEALDWQKKRK